MTVVLLLLLCGASWSRGWIYTDETTFWADTAAKSPGKSRTRNNLGYALKEAYRFEEAGREFERALELNPDYPDALNNLATIYCNINRKEEAMELLHKALILNPNHLPARFNLSLQYYEKGLLDDAAQEYNAILQTNPNCKEAVFARQMLRIIRQ